MRFIFLPRVTASSLPGRFSRRLQTADSEALLKVGACRLACRPTKSLLSHRSHHPGHIRTYRCFWAYKSYVFSSDRRRTRIHGKPTHDHYSHSTAKALACRHDCQPGQWEVAVGLEGGIVDLILWICVNPIELYRHLMLVWWLYPTPALQSL